MKNCLYSLKSYLLPNTFETLTLGEANQLVRILRAQGLVASYFLRLKNAGLVHILPSRCLNLFEAAEVFSQAQKRQVVTVLNEIKPCFEQAGVEFMALKGAAYVAAETANSDGRLFSDIDVLVSKEDLNKTEEMLLNNGWIGKKVDDYDNRYYRDWSHELPPFYHPRLGCTLDLHHTLIPPISGKSVDIGHMFKSAVNTDIGVRVPSIQWMIFHSALHLIVNEDATNALRDLTDINLLIASLQEDELNILIDYFESNGFRKELILLAHLLERFFEYDKLKSLLTDKRFNMTGITKLHLYCLTRSIIPNNRFIPDSSFPVSRFLNFGFGHIGKMPFGVLAKHSLNKIYRLMVKAVFGSFFFRGRETQ